MKRGSFILGVFGIFLLFSSMIVYGQDSGSSGNIAEAEGSVKSDLKQAGGNVSSEIKDLTKGLQGKGEDLLEREVSMPSWLSMPARILFGVVDGISWQRLIILIGVWVMMLLIILSLVKLIPILDSPLISIAISFIITCLISVSGGMSFLGRFIYDISGFFGILQKYEVLHIVSSLVLSSILVFIISKIIGIIKKSTRLAKAEQAGREAGAGIEMQRRTYNHLRNKR